MKAHFEKLTNPLIVFQSKELQEGWPEGTNAPNMYLENLEII